VQAVKSNIGHLEGASGLAGIIKTVLALERGVVAPNTNFERLNDDIDAEFFHLTFPAAAVPWPEDEHGSDVRRASVNSFGYGGTNAHAVLDDAPSYLRSRGLEGNHRTRSIHPQSQPAASASRDDDESRPVLLVLSAADKEGIARQTKLHEESLHRLKLAGDGALLARYASALANRGASLAWKSFCVLNSASQADELASRISSPTQGLGAVPSLGFAFTGQGAQWHGMARELLVCPQFRDSLLASQCYLEALGWTLSLPGMLVDETQAKSINQANISQVLTTSVQIALVHVFKWLHISPSVVVGHSSGEIAASYCAGLISHKSAMKISYYRGVLSSILESYSEDRHSMMAVGLSAEDANADIASFQKTFDFEPGCALTISCMNSPTSTTISGPDSAIKSLVLRLAQKQIFARQLKVGVGYHSPQMLRIAPTYLNLIGRLEPGEAHSKIVMVSSVTGLPIDRQLACNAEYWVRNMVSPVDFTAAIKFCTTIGQSNDIRALSPSHLAGLSIDGWLEVGPHSALQGPIKDTIRSTLREGPICYTSTLIRNVSALNTLLNAAGYLHCHNFKVDLTKATSLGYSRTEKRVVPPRLPPYPFNHSIIYWDESQCNKNFRFRLHGNHDFLGTRVNESLSHDEAQWKMHISQEEMAWVKDHRVQGAVLYPAGGTVVMVLEAAKQLISGRTPLALELEDVSFPAPIQVPSTHEGVELRLHMSSRAGSGRHGDIDHLFRVFIHHPDNTDKEVCSGALRGDYGRVASDVNEGVEEANKLLSAQADYSHALQSCRESIESSKMYQQLRDYNHLDYGPSFQPLDDVTFDLRGNAIATLLPISIGDGSPSIVHPSRLDGVFQLGFAALRGLDKPYTMVPTRISKMRIPLSGFGHPADSPEKVYANTTHASPRSVTFSFSVFNQSELQLKASIEGLELTALSNDAEVPKSIVDTPYLHSYMDWKLDLETLNHIEIQQYCEQEAGSTKLGSFGTYLDCLVHKHPNLRFCALSGGSIAWTADLLEILSEPSIGSRFEEYMFTDVNELHVEMARQRFSNNRRVHCKVLDISIDPSLQKLEQGNYDVIVVDSALYNSMNPAASLRHIQRLMKPGARLVFRAEKASRDLWDATLNACGFSGIDLIFEDLPSKDGQQWSTMISTVSNSNAPISHTRPQPPVFILNSVSPLQNMIAQTLRYEFGTDHASDYLSLTDAAALSQLEARDFIMLYELDDSLLNDISELDFTSLQTLLRCARSFTWVKQRRDSNSGQSLNFDMTEGLCRVSHYENSQVGLVILAVELDGEQAAKRIATNILKVYFLTQAQLKTGDFEHEYVEMDGRLRIHRLTRAKELDEDVFSRANQLLSYKEVGDQNLKLTIQVPGLLDTIAFTEDKAFRNPLGAEEIDIEVKAIGLNFKDGLALLGRVTSHSGCEYSGVVRAVGSSVTDVEVGDRVVNGLRDSFRTYGRVPARDVIKIPHGISFAEAASIPTVFRTAYFCLYDIARLQKGESILIHRAAGGTGQAAIQLALEIGAKVYATVGSLSKKQFLIEHYGLDGNNIFYSRDTSFVDGLQRVTQGRGVDVVLNSLTGRLLEASWECVAPFGRFIEIGLSDAYSRNKLPMFPFLKGISFSCFNLDLFQSGELHDRLMDNVFKLLVTGKIRPPTPLHTFPLGKIENAFRFLHSGESTGKLVVEVSKQDVLPVISSREESGFKFPLDATYLISGGLGGVGRSIARWLCRKGAKNLILLSRSGPSGNKKAQELLSELATAGVNVLCPQVDIVNLVALKSVIVECSKTLPPIKGCFQGAMVLRDSTLSRMSISEWNQGTSPKVQGSWNLHQVLPTGMDFFVLLSSLVGVYGNGGQSNYAAGSTFEDALARYRVSNGEKAVSLDLGLILDDGVVAENEALLNHLLRRDMILPIPRSQLFALLDRYCDPGCELLSPKKSQVVTGLNLPANILARGRPLPGELQTPSFRILQQMDADPSLVVDNSTSQHQSVKSAFCSAPSLADAAIVVAEALKEKLAKVLGISTEDIGCDQPLESFGIDSLVGLEIRNWLSKELGVDMAVFEIQSMSSKGIGKAVSAKSSFRRASD
jgi:acyl transferase domain-containing protein/NADPH:quinone reductase-like Zn-dependent oxidoreductase/SAM-dependent methyltransferase